jgi:hypothetical protein
MAKRFIDTEIWERDWFLDLSPEERQSLIFITCKCDLVGIYRHNAMNQFVLGSVTVESLIEKTNGRIEHLGGNKYWLPNFCKFQYGDLSHNSPPHRKYIGMLKEYDLFDRVSDRVGDSVPTSVPDRVCNSVPERVCHTLQEEEEEEDKEKETEKEEETDKAKDMDKEKETDKIQFDGIWKIYGMRGPKAKALDFWKKLTEKNKDKLAQSIKPFCKETPELKFRPHFFRYIRDNQFLDVLEREENGCLNIPQDESDKPPRMIGMPNGASLREKA